MPVLKGLMRFLERSGAIILILFAGLFLAFIINSPVALTVTAIVLSFYLINEGMKGGHSPGIKFLNLALGAYLLFGVFTRTITISLGVTSIYPLSIVYPYQLFGSTSAIATFMSIYILAFGASALAGLRLEGEELFEASAAVGAIGAVVLILIGLFTDPTTFIEIGRSIPFLQPIISMMGFLGDIIALMFGQFFAVIIVFAVALLGAMVGEFVF